MKKTIWVSSLIPSKEEVQGLMSKMKKYGLDIDGHFWEDDLEKLSWMKPREKLIDTNISLWAILGSAQALNSESIRYGLSVLTATVQANRGLGFPITILLTEGSLDPDSLPTLLKGVEVLQVSDAGLGAKLVARVHAPAKDIISEYRLDVYGNTQIGQWFEIGPREGQWEGAMLGVDEGEIEFQAVGLKGRLPSTAVLNYPMQGLKLNLGSKEYTAWAVKNNIDSDNSYFVKIKGFPSTIIFGSYSELEEAEVFVVNLK